MQSPVRLDFLANFPQNQAANALLTDTFANPNTFDNTFIAAFKADSCSLAHFFGAEYALAFDYSCGEFLSLFCTLSSYQYHIALAPSLSQQSFYAAKSFCAIKPQCLSFLPLNQEGIIEHIPPLQNALENIAFFIPLLNQDLLTLNPLQSLINEILSHYKNALIFCDISLFASTLTQENLHFLRSLCNESVLFICNAESIGLMRKNAFILTHTHTLNPALKAYNDTQLLRPHLFAAALKALEDILASPQSADSKLHFFESLQAKLKDDVALFAPLAFNAPNTLALRLKRIKARLLIQSLQIEGIYAINGQDCLFGNAKPSFVLESMGYEEAQCRELLSISYAKLENIESTTTRLASAYLQLRQFS
ncbi:MAG: cysteine desulfurase [Helicobacter sp.]|uniref:cysteine desulfurase n=1 Tax=Helicobacter sp. TaxID=218 RepID=UPI0025BE3C7A|nr:cysteine desulfurase [Helicobacter sp.]MCH5313028.1 cysteine desulfurase [Helicobacter sp.]